MTPLKTKVRSVKIDSAKGTISIEVETVGFDSITKGEIVQWLAKEQMRLDRQKK